MPTQETLKNLFTYKDGELYWKVKPLYSHVDISSPAGYSDNHHDYKIVMISKKHYRVHRLIFTFHHNYTPVSVDHIDGNKRNNNIQNLRAVTHSQNSHNAKLSVRNNSGFKGVSFVRSLKKWKGGVCKNGKTTYTKGFYAIEDAVSATVKLRKELHGDYANNG